MSEKNALLKGRLTPDRFGASMPVDAPYYQQPPFYWRDARSMTILYETDAEAAADLLPEGLELPRPAHAALMVVHYPASTVGPYSEAILGLRCAWQGAPQLYVARIVVDEVPPLVVGREIYGYPKKLAAIDLSNDGEFLRGTVERPSDVRLVTAAMRIERPLETAAEAATPVLSLRVIPSPEQDTPPSVAELVQVEDTERRVHEAWSGPATLSYEARSALDPWHGLPVRQVLGGIYTRYDFTLPWARVLKRY